MKKLLTVCALGALSFSVYAQGLVSIQETAFAISTNATAAVGGTSGKIGATANSYYFELLTISDPSGSTTLPTIANLQALLSWADSGVSGTNYTGINAGHVNGISPATGVAVNGWAAGATNFTVVVGWSANEGSSWATVSNEILNNTLVSGYNTAIGYAEGYLAAGQAPSPFPTVFGANPGQIGSITLTAVPPPVPEPGTLALAALGGASLLMFRRKK